MSSRVTWVVAYSSGRTKSSRMSDDTGVVHFKGVEALTRSSIRSEMAAAVNDFVVEPA